MRPNILGGDSAQQIEAIWNYLSEGERAKKPAGLSRQSNELRVGDVAEICRGRGSLRAFAASASGYPERVNLVFDSGEMSLRVLWSGEFANVDFGSFHPRGDRRRDHASLRAFPFTGLQSPDENWPYKGKTNHAFPQDRGYASSRATRSMRSAARPSLLAIGDIAVEDFFEDVVQKGRVTFKRTLLFTAPARAARVSFPRRCG
jgi:hypothetical protein